MKQQNLFSQIRKIVGKISHGNVSTYGQVAEMAGIRDARVVGWALRGNKDPSIPCHRVVKAKGFLAAGYSLGDWREQKRRLEAEGVRFVSEDRLDLEKYLWRPK